MNVISAAPLDSYSPEDRAFYSFWYGHMQDDLMQPPLSGVSHAEARYIWDAALTHAYAEGRKDEAEDRAAMLQRVTKALADLSFECFGGIGTNRPSLETYNRTFDVLQEVRAVLKASA